MDWRLGPGRSAMRKAVSISVSTKPMSMPVQRSANSKRKPSKLEQADIMFNYGDIRKKGVIQCWRIYGWKDTMAVKEKKIEQMIAKWS